MKNIPISTLEANTGLGQNSIFTWDKVKPSVDKVLRVAQYLEVSVDSLLGNVYSSDIKLSTLKPSSLQVLDVLEQLDLSDKSTEVIIDMAYSLAQHIDSCNSDTDINNENNSNLNKKGLYFGGK